VNTGGCLGHKRINDKGLHTVFPRAWRRRRTRSRGWDTCTRAQSRNIRRFHSMVHLRTRTYQCSNIHTSHVSSLRILISQSQGAVQCRAVLLFPAGSMKCPAHKAPAPAQLHQRCSAASCSEAHGTTEGRAHVQDGHDALGPAW
jgi:hypothetical protein